MMTRKVLLNMELEEDDDEDGDIGECRSPGRGWGWGGSWADASARKPKLPSNFGSFSCDRSGCSRVHDTPEPDSPRPRAAPQHRPAETQTKGLERRARGRDAGRRRAEDGGTFPLGLRDVKTFPLTASRHFPK